MKTKEIREKDETSNQVITNKRRKVTKRGNRERGRKTKTKDESKKQTDIESEKQRQIN